MMDTSEIRKAYIELISNLIGLPGYDTLVPVDESPDRYFIVSNVTRTSTAAGKAHSSDNTAYRRTENRVFINVDIVVVTELGVHSSLEVEDLVDSIVESVKRGLRPDGYLVKETLVQNTVPLHLTTESNQIQRMVVSFEHWVQKRNSYPGLIIDNNPAGADWPTLYAPENMNRDWDMLIDSNDPGQSGCIYAPLDKCTMVGAVIDDNPAEEEHNLVYRSW